MTLKISDSFSEDNRVYVYYHQADSITACLLKLGFEILDLQRKQYSEPDGSFLTDMIFIARKKRKNSRPYARSEYIPDND